MGCPATIAGLLTHIDEVETRPIRRWDPLAHPYPETGPVQATGLALRAPLSTPVYPGYYQCQRYFLRCYCGASTSKHLSGLGLTHDARPVTRQHTGCMNLSNANSRSASTDQNFTLRNIARGCYSIQRPKCRPIII